MQPAFSLSHYLGRLPFIHYNTFTPLELCEVAFHGDCCGYGHSAPSRFAPASCRASGGQGHMLQAVGCLLIYTE